jgi:RHS repeat-associated protein
MHLGTYAAGTTYFHHADWLGTERVRSAMTAQACETVASLAFGDGQATTGSCGDPSPLHFTAKQRDLESGLDYFGARYNASSMGRFMSPDPVDGSISDPQSLNAYVYLHNSPLNGTDPTGAIVEWSDSGKTQKGGEAHPRTSAQRAFENRLKQMRESKDPKTRERGERLTHTYERLQASKATFEVTNEHGSEESKGEITYQGNDHFTVSLAGDPALFLSDNQRLAHEFEHGRQVLDGEYSFIHTPTGWKPFAHDRTDEAEGFQAGFDMERAQPGQGSVANNIQRQLDMGGISAGADFLRGVGDYNTLPKGPVNVEYSTPSIYKVPQ